MTYFYLKLDFSFQLDLTMLSIAMIFPLVFNIRSSFRRREKALEHLSEFRSALKTLYYFYTSNNNLTEDELLEIKYILIEINQLTLANLKDKNPNLKQIDAAIHKVYQFAVDRPETVPRNLRDKVFRFLKDLHESIENVFAIHSHRTPISLKAYCEIFIYIFPLVYAPTIIFSIDVNYNQWVIYAIVLLTQFILISLFNIQNQLEYPFDSVGLDDIKLEGFKFDR